MDSTLFRDEAQREVLERFVATAIDFAVEAASPNALFVAVDKTLRLFDSLEKVYIIV